MNIVHDLVYKHTLNDKVNVYVPRHSVARVLSNHETIMMAIQRHVPLICSLHHPSADNFPISSFIVFDKPEDHNVSVLTIHSEVSFRSTMHRVF